MIVKENTELKQLVNLSQLVTRPSCCCTSSGVVQPSPSMLMSLHSYFTIPIRDNVSCQCRFCLSHQSYLTNTLSPTIGTAALPRLSGGGSRTEDHHSVENVLQNIEMCSQNPAVTKTLQGICPAELRDKFAIHDISTKQLKQQLGDVECEVRNMQVELANVQRERQQLEQQRKLLKCTGPCAPCISCPLSPPVCVTPLPILPLTSTLPGSAVSVVSRSTAITRSS